MLARLEFWVGATCGVLATVLLNEPATGALRSFFSPDVRIAKIQAKLDRLNKDIPASQAELIRQAELLRDRLDTEAATAQSCQKKLTDLEFKLDAKNSPRAQPAEACLQELDTIKAITLRRAEASRQLGGRIHFGVKHIQDYAGDAWCEVHATTDTVASTHTNLRPGDSLQLKTSIGHFRLVATKVANAKESNNVYEDRYCLFDLVRQR